MMYYLLKKIENRKFAENQNGIDLESIACQKLCAASVEALVNWMVRSVITE